MTRRSESAGMVFRLSFGLLLLAGTVLGQAGEWQQCGGIGWQVCPLSFILTSLSTALIQDWRNNVCRWNCLH